MSEITGETLSYKKHVGWWKGELVAINPSREQLNKIIGGEDDREIEYTGEKEGVDTAKITLWFKETTKGLFFSHSITLKNEVRFNKNKDKVQYINQIGDTTWVKIDENGNKDESTLWNSFKHWTKVVKWKLEDGSLSTVYERGAKPGEEQILGDKVFRPALVGEEQLAKFVRVWLSKIDVRKPGAQVLFDSSKFFKGNFKSLQGEIGGDYEGDSTGNKSFVGLAYVSVDEEDVDKKYQRIWKEFLPGSIMKFINNGKFSGWAERKMKEYKEQVEGEYGVNGFVTYDVLREYNEEEDICSAKEGMVEEHSDVDDNY